MCELPDKDRQRKNKNYEWHAKILSNGSQCPDALNKHVFGTPMGQPCLSMKQVQMLSVTETQGSVFVCFQHGKADPCFVGDGWKGLEAGLSRSFRPSV